MRTGPAEAPRGKHRSIFPMRWWMPDVNRYADSLCNAGDEPDPPAGAVNVCRAPDTQLQQQHWINATPMEMAFGRTDYAVAALDSLPTLPPASADRYCRGTGSDMT